VRPFVKTVRTVLSDHCPVLSVTLVYCGQIVGWIKMKLSICMEVGLDPGHIVLEGTQLLPKRGTAPQFSAHVHCGPMAGWIKMPLGLEVGLGPGDCVRWGPSSPQKGGTAPNFWPVSIVAKRLDGSRIQDATWYRGRSRPRRHCVIWGPSSPPQKGHSPQFSAHVYCCQMAGWIKVPLGTE